MVSDGVDYSLDSSGPNTTGFLDYAQVDRELQMNCHRTSITFDLDGLKSWYGGNLQQLLSWFLEDVSIALAKIKSYAAAGEFQQVGDVAHEIKGVSGTIGARRMYEILVDLETACKDGDFGASQAFIAELSGELAEIGRLAKTV